MLIASEKKESVSSVVYPLVTPPSLNGQLQFNGQTKAILKQNQKDESVNRRERIVNICGREERVVVEVTKMY